ncbi:hypothetical protein DNK47_02420 [Mycoplasma wenyonii]|uniref:Uncharacterized protein n=1 Tax=Mycoplasma wenyonii TaxID=65123 RepID=A0A328PJE0_9MOLU|nr:hypothetical protein [Mycoplasma wenyonii]RAO94942.1 hypothetical protein DNK47_02420 [Mycoplasma wenyonii]
MASPVLKIGFAVVALGLSGGTYRLVSHYRGNTESNSLVTSSLNGSDQVLKGESSLNPSGDTGQSTLGTENTFIQPDSHNEALPERHQDDGQEATGHTSEDSVSSGLVFDSEPRELGREESTEMSLGVSSSADHSTHAPSEPVETGKCRVVSTSATILKSIATSEQDYYTIFCDNGDTGDISLLSKWTGLFPKSIFKEGMQFNVDQQLNIDLNTEMDGDIPSSEEITSRGESLGVGDWYGIKATSNKFLAETITGFWGYKTFDTNDSGAVIVLDDSRVDQEIYLVFNQEDQA